MIALMPMRHLAVLVVLLVGCGNHGIPRDRSIEATFPKQPQITEHKRQLRVMTFNVHMEPGKKIVEAIRSDPALMAADVIFLQEVERDERVGEPCSDAC